METQLALDNQGKELQLLFKKNLQHPSGLELKIDGALNTVTAESHATARLSKVTFLTLPLAKAPSSNGENAAAPALGLRLGIGAQASTRSDDVLVIVDAKQKSTLRSSTVQLRHRTVTRNLTQATVRANYRFNPRTQKGSGEATAAVQHTIFDATADQDLRFTLGLSVPCSGVTVGQPQPFLKIQENCWGVSFTRGGGWQVTYDL